MPTYTYRCADCGHQFDAVQRFSDEPLRECPTCAGAIRRVIQPVGVVFKGSGWYINDSRKSQDDGAKASKAGQDDKAGTEKTDGVKTSGDKPADVTTPAAADSTKAPEKAAAAAATSAKAAD